MPLLILIGIVLLIGIIAWLSEIMAKASKYTALKPKLDNLQKYEEELNSKRITLENKQIAWKQKVIEDKNAIERMCKEKASGFPWLAEAFSDYFHLMNLKEAAYMEHKTRPAVVSAEKVRVIARERRNIEKKLRIAQGVIKYYQNLFPFLEDFLGEEDEEILRQVLSQYVGQPIQEIAEIGIDPVRVFLSKEEYDKLSSIEKSQLALDRYWSKRKTKWQIGKEYERYVGYKYEKKGYRVYYQGILEGLDDLGRDLICKKPNKTLVIQCKRWSVHKTIHEKHVNQLYGTFARYQIDHPDEDGSPVLFTTTKLSERAKDFAKFLKVEVVENFPFSSYPAVKCNVSRKDGKKYITCLLTKCMIGQLSRKNVENVMLKLLKKQNLLVSAELGNGKEWIKNRILQIF